MAEPAEEVAEQEPEEEVVPVEEQPQPGANVGIFFLRP
jgi:hypothetical protein